MQENETCDKTEFPNIKIKQSTQEKCDKIEFPSIKIKQSTQEKCDKIEFPNIKIKQTTQEKTKKDSIKEARSTDDGANENDLEPVTRKNDVHKPSRQPGKDNILKLRTRRKSVGDIPSFNANEYKHRSTGVGGANKPITKRSRRKSDLVSSKNIKDALSAETALIRKRRKKKRGESGAKVHLQNYMHLLDLFVYVIPRPYRVVSPSRRKSL